MSDGNSATVCSEGSENGCIPLSEIPETDNVPGGAVDINDSEEEDLYEHEVPPVVEIERDLDTLTYSGSTINDLEIQLTRTKQLYQRTLLESRRQVDTLKRKLNTHIQKAEPFIEIWRKARQVQEESNKAAMRYDKASSQHAASKEMIRVAEAQLGSRVVADGPDPSSPSPLDLAWQEMLNHATFKVVETEKERRDTELEHRAILEEVNRVMEEYRRTERKLRTHIVKSRPYYEQRFRANQQLQQMKQRMQDLDSKINESKRAYTATLKRLEALNTEIHHRRANSQTLDPRMISSTGNTPQLGRGFKGSYSDTESLDSLQVPGGFTGSTGSLPSLGTSSVSETSPSPENVLEIVGRDPLERVSPLVNNSHSATSSGRSSPPSNEEENEDDPVIDAKETIREYPQEVNGGSEKQVASELVRKCLAAAVVQLEQTLNQS